MRGVAKIGLGCRSADVNVLDHFARWLRRVFLLIYDYLPPKTRNPSI